MPKYRQIMDAVELLNGIDPEVIKNLNASPRTLEALKARGLHAEELRPSERIEDVFMNYHRTPTREEIEVGPVLPASGDTRRASEVYDLNPAFQHDETSRLGRLLEILEGGLRLAQKELEKAKAKRVRMQQNYPASATGANGDEPREDEELEEEDEAAKGLASVPSFTAGGDLDTFSASVKDVFNLLLGRGLGMPKSEVILAKAATAANHLDGTDSMLAMHIVQRATAVKAGAVTPSDFAKLIANAPGEVISALQRAIEA